MHGAVLGACSVNGASKRSPPPFSLLKHGWARGLDADKCPCFAGQKVYGHKAVLSARCEVLSAMFSGNFREGSSSDAIEEVHHFLLCMFFRVAAIL